MKSLTEFIKENNIKPNGFVILKPGFLQHEKEFVDLLDNKGWKMIEKSKKRLTKNQAESLYNMHKDKPFFPALSEYMSSGDCLCCTCYKDDTKDPIKDMDKLKDQVRDNWGKDDMENAMHSSDSLENVSRESDICINGDQTSPA